MSTAEIAQAAAEHIAAAITRQAREAWCSEQGIVDIAEPVIRGAIARALEEAVQPPARTFVVQGGHVSLDLNLNAKGELQYGAKVVMPIDGLAPADAGLARERAQTELERAEAFLRTRYGRTP